MLKSFCRVYIEKFPFDSQTCNITFASWTADANMLFLRTKRGDSNAKKDHTFSKASNGEWEVVDFPSSHAITNRTVGFDESQVRPYAEVTFQLKLKRKYLFHQCYMIFPCMLLSWLGALVFIMPIESGEKISFCTTIFLSLIVFLLLIADNIPRSSDGVPILGIYFTLSIAYVGLSVLGTILVLNVGLKQKQFCMPHWLKRLLHSRLSTLFCFHIAKMESSQKWVSFRMFSGGKSPGSSKENYVTDAEEMNPVGNGDQTERIVSDAQVPAGAAMPPCSSLAGNDWRLLAVVMDRMFFWVYIILNIISTFYICCAAT